MTWLASSQAARVKRGFAGLKGAFGGKKVVRCFLELDDPYSYLLSCFLPGLHDSFDIVLDYRLVESLGDGYRPRPDMHAEYALADCERIARELGLPFLDKGMSPPVEHRRAALEYLAASAREADADAELLQVLAYYWRGDTANVARRAEGNRATGEADRLLQDNARLLERLGHYCGGTLYYGGEWFAGIGRLHYLIERLQGSGRMRRDSLDRHLVSLLNVTQPDLPVAPPNAAKSLPTLELFFSFRSPYSHIGLRSLLAVTDAFGLRVNLRPVLPMVMRGMEVPRNKAEYFMRDAGREARRLGVPMGKIVDPVGEGVERCHAVFDYADSERRGRAFALAATEAIWSRGVDVESDEGMRDICDDVGLFWPDTLNAMRDSTWQSRAEANLESMMESGSWGVPTVTMGDFVAWGQDRDWLLARHLEHLCDTGEGILI